MPGVLDLHREICKFLRHPALRAALRAHPQILIEIEDMLITIILCHACVRSIGVMNSV